MNTSILVNSLRFVKKFGLLINLSTWIINELIKINNCVGKLYGSIYKINHDLSYTIVKKSLELGIDFDKNLLLKEVSKYGQDKVVNLLINAGVDITTKDNYSIRWASRNGHLEVVKLLINAGADVTAKDNYALIYASSRGHYEIVEVLINAGADVTADDNFALRCASDLGHPEIVSLLINSGRIDLNSCNNYTIKYQTKDSISK